MEESSLVMCALCHANRYNCTISVEFRCRLQESWVFFPNACALGHVGCESWSCRVVSVESR